MEVEEHILRSTMQVQDLNAMIKGRKVLDIKYSCCCDAMGSKVVTCALVMYDDNVSAYEKGVEKWQEKHQEKH